MFPLGEPQLLGRVIHRAVVEDAVVVDEAAEAVGPLARDPVDHEAAVGRAKGANAVAVEEVVAVERRREAQLEVLERLAAPVARDAVRERLAVAGRTVEIDHHGGEPLPGVGLRVPAVMEAVGKAALRAAVDEKCHRVLLAALHARGLHDEAINGIAAGALEGELLELAHGHARERARAEVRDAAAVAGAGIKDVEFVGRSQVIH